jgi:hypothetical protein
LIGKPRPHSARPRRPFWELNEDLATHILAPPSERARHANERCGIDQLDGAQIDAKNAGGRRQAFHDFFSTTGGEMREKSGNV